MDSWKNKRPVVVERDNFLEGLGRWRLPVIVVGPFLVLLLLFTPVGWGLIGLAILVLIPACMIWAWWDERRAAAGYRRWLREHGDSETGPIA